MKKYTELGRVRLEFKTYSEIELIIDNNNIVLSRICPFCKEVNKLEIPIKNVNSINKMLEWNYFDDVNVELYEFREFISTGLCENCL